MIYFLCLSLMIVVCCYCAVIGNSTTDPIIVKDFYKQHSTHIIYDQNSPLLEIEDNVSNNTVTNAAKTRFKRQQSSGAGKFTEAAQVPQLKLLRLFLTMFKNLWASSHTGGSNPFHPYVPKPIVQLFKYRIVEFFFPDVGVETIKTK